MGNVGDLLSLEYGKPLPEADRVPDGVPAYGANGILCWSRQAYRTDPSIIVGRKGSAGEVTMTEGPFWPTDVTYFVTHDRNQTDLRYIFHLLCWLELPRLAKGVKPGINRNDVYALSAPCPTLREQQRIAAILDEAFAGIAKATANVERNIASAQELSSKMLDALLCGEQGTRNMALEDAVTDDCTLSYGIVQPGDETPDGLPIVRPVDIGSRTVGLDGLKRIAPERAAGYRRTTLQGNDLLLCVRGTTGVLSQAIPELAGANVTRGLVPIRFRPDVVQQDLGYFLLLSDGVQRQIRKATYGAALMQINIRDLRRITLTVPPPSRQSTLLAALEEGTAAASRLAEGYRTKLAALSELRTSLLHQAFTGQLTDASVVAA
jgi:type I restriction enzyme S subunit